MSSRSSACRHAQVDIELNRAAGELCKSLTTSGGQGYSVDDEEALIGLRCVSAVVYDDCSGTSGRISFRARPPAFRTIVCPFLGKQVQEVAAELTMGSAARRPDAKSF